MDWTVVRHKRSTAGTRVRRNASVTTTAAGGTAGCRIASRAESPKVPAEVLIKADNSCHVNDREEEERLVGKVERAIAKVEQSKFFAGFVKQLQDLEVVEHLSRSGQLGLTGKIELGEAHGVVGEESANEESHEEDQLLAFTSTVELVVYGVGSIANSEISRCQLALAILLKRRLAPIRNISVFDPIITASECGAMRTLGCMPLEDNEDGRRALSGPTLFYMPHCDVELYESVLQANLKRGNISQLVILGNSFRTYRDRWSVSPLPHGERPCCLLKVQEFVEEIPVADSFTPTAFNDTSWHFFSKVEVSEL